MEIRASAELEFPHRHMSGRSSCGQVIRWAVDECVSELSLELEVGNLGRGEVDERREPLEYSGIEEPVLKQGAGCRQRVEAVETSEKWFGSGWPERVQVFAGFGISSDGEVRESRA